MKYYKILIENAGLTNFLSNSGGSGSVIKSRGTVNISDSVIQNNEIINSDDSNSFAAGGAVYSYSGVLAVDNGLFAGNTARSTVGRRIAVRFMPVLPINQR